MRSLWASIGLGAARLRHTARGRTLLTMLSVALAIATLLIITGLAVGMATQGTVPAHDSSYAVLPEAADASSPIASFDNAQFGHAHEATERMQSHEAVTGASPILAEFTTLETASGDSTRVLVLGVIPDENVSTVAGISASGLETETTYYDADRNPDDWTGQAVLSSGAAEVLGYQVNDDIDAFGDDYPFHVTHIADDDASGALGGTPIILVHLAEFQSVLGVDEHDQAHQFLVSATSDEAVPHLESVYEQSTVSTQTGMTTDAATAGGMPTALLGMALVVSAVIGALFLLTAIGLEVAADRRQLSTMAALGLSRRTRTTMLASQTLLIGLCGGLLGVLLGFLGIRAVNSLLPALDYGPAVAVSEPWFALLGMGVALGIALITLPYVAIVGTRVSATEAIK